MEERLDEIIRLLNRIVDGIEKKEVIVNMPAFDGESLAAVRGAIDKMDKRKGRLRG